MPHTSTGIKREAQWLVPELLRVLDFRIQLLHFTSASFIPELMLNVHQENKNLG